LGGASMKKSNFKIAYLFQKDTQEAAAEIERKFGIQGFLGGSFCPPQNASPKIHSFRIRIILKKSSDFIQ